MPDRATQPSWPFSRQEAALIAITMLWGTTFLIVHLAMRHSGPFFFVGLRFVTAGIVALVVFRRVLAGLTRQELFAGLAVGVSIFLGYGLQTLGLQTISSSKSAFITALYVPLVPLLQWLVLREVPRPLALVGIVLAFAGLVLLAGPEAGGGAVGPGELATILSAFAIAAEILLIGRFARRVDVRRITAVQLLSAGLLAWLVMPALGEPLPAFSWVWLGAALGLGVASVLIQLAINWAQRSVPPLRATIIYAGEPVWGGVVGRLAGDRLPPEAFAGAALVLLGTLVSGLRPRRRPGSR
ncbi:DMT family transporter [Rubrivivax gelatinosus]|uniref:DMT family transporter n=1 Tax=Rubrivivax gelatinosus TaxID=28068 RepID=UPI0031FA1C4F